MDGCYRIWNSGRDTKIYMIATVVDLNSCNKAYVQAALLINWDSLQMYRESIKAIVNQNTCLLSVTVAIVSE